MSGGGAIALSAGHPASLIEAKKIRHSLQACPCHKRPAYTATRGGCSWSGTEACRAFPSTILLYVAGPEIIRRFRESLGSGIGSHGLMDGQLLLGGNLWNDWCATVLQCYGQAGWAEGGEECCLSPISRVVNALHSRSGWLGCPAPGLEVSTAACGWLHFSSQGTGAGIAVASPPFDAP